MSDDPGHRRQRSAARPGPLPGGVVMTAELELPAPADGGRVVAFQRRPAAPLPARIRRTDTMQWLSACAPIQRFFLRYLSPEGAAETYQPLWSPQREDALTLGPGDVIIIQDALLEGMEIETEIIYG